MKKVLALLLLASSFGFTYAQQSVQGSSFLDNWSVGLIAGGIVPTTHSNYIKDVRAAYGVELNKRLTPYYTMGFQFVTAHNTSCSANAFDAINLTALGKLNLTNFFCGFQKCPRFLEIEGVGGIGWGHEYYPSTIQDDRNFISVKYGLEFNLNLGEKKAWTVSLRPTMVHDLNHRPANSNPSFKFGQSAFEVLAGVTYHFKNSNNGKHHLTIHRGYDQAEVDGLNAKVNDLRSMLRQKNELLKKRNQEILKLQHELNETRNQLPRIQNPE